MLLVSITTYVHDKFNSAVKGVMPCDKFSMFYDTVVCQILNMLPDGLRGGGGCSGDI